MADSREGGPSDSVANSREGGPSDSVANSRGGRLRDSYEREGDWACHIGGEKSGNS